MAVDMYHLIPYYTDHSNAFLCVETGECFSDDDDIYRMMKNEYTFIRMPNSNRNNEMKEFITQNSELLFLFNFSNPIEFSIAFHQSVNEFDLYDCWAKYSYQQRKRELVKWCVDNSIEWTDDYS